ncbi:DUF3791 domain-containing protein [uncultured Acetatifactor sp.]|uniref:DUF3791 domain-containing protein n=2 Tax=uncultured Acetatifactor sp. TaxID=1671927 RepID=UPI00263720A9|nr:DUF3791 domain-containing protein [uncultured Acetatifactor sp.]MCI8697021.1 DUF3791 domain-containing protein [Lachnospiraceae bacterium]MCI9651929.1 DUF3791 domain-containing protein [Lachnospiraceae bacterium]
MSERQQIIYMQARIMRLASERWNKPMEKVAALFTQYNALRYIEECFDMFHVEGDEAILEDVETYLKGRGMREGAEIGG